MSRGHRSLALEVHQFQHGGHRRAVRSHEFNADREVMLEAVRNDGLVLEFASEELQNDPELKKLAEG